MGLLLVVTMKRSFFSEGKMMNKLIQNHHPRQGNCQQRITMQPKRAKLHQGMNMKMVHQ